MASYYLIFLWFGFMSMIAKKPQYNEIVIVDGKEEIRNKFIFAFIVFLPICIMAMNREATLGDLDGYFYSFKRAPSTLQGIGEYLDTVEKDKGFSFLNVFIRSVISTKPIVYGLIIALIQGLCLIKVYRRYSTDFVLTVFLFFASTDMVSWMCNGVRQFLAATLIFVVTPLVLKKKLFWPICVILLASTIHLSAIITIPFFIIALNEAWNKKTVIFIVGIIVVLIAFTRFSNFLDGILSDTQYYYSVNEGLSAGGTNIIRVIVYAVPTVIAFIYKERIKILSSSIIDFCINMSIISTGIYVVSVLGGGITFGRVAIYASLFNYILLPWEIDNLFDKNRQMVKVLMVVSYLFFYYYQMHFSWTFL